MAELSELYDLYLNNVTPAMVDVLAGQLHVSRESLIQLGAAWKPNDNAWVFPERDAEGEIIGLIRRFQDGSKFCIAGSKRGLTYVATAVEEGYVASRQSWERVTKDNPCPICGRIKFCSLDGNASPPRFVRCTGTGDGARHGPDRGGAFIHELVPGAFRPPAVHVSPLCASEYPVLIVEGQTDCAAAMDLGFVAVGRPSAHGGLAFLADLVQGRPVAIIGENDAGAGREGMEKTFLALRDKCPGAVKLLPPPGIKDLREWIGQAGLTTEALLDLTEHGDPYADPDVLDNADPMPVARRWLRDVKSNAAGTILLRTYRGGWYEWRRGAYRDIAGVGTHPDREVKDQLYHWLEDKQCVAYKPDGSPILKDFAPNRKKILDIFDTLSCFCSVESEAPCWLAAGETLDPRNLLVFQNGVLNLAEYFCGTGGMSSTTPDLFNLSIFPYNFDPEALCPQWLKFLSEIFENDPTRVALLQEWIGYNMITDLSREKMMLMVGRPGSGKGTTLAVMQAVLGSARCARSSFKNLCSAFGLQPLLDKPTIIFPDAHVPRSVDSTQALEQIKTITGGDPLSVNRKYLMEIPEVLLPGRITMAVNELPELPDHAMTLSRRMLVLLFAQTFEGREDMTLKTRLPKEAAGIALWALAGLRRLQTQNIFTEPETSVRIKNEFRKFVTPIAEFVTECCVLDPETRVTQEELYDTWAVWAKSKGLRTGVASRFVRRVCNQHPEVVNKRRARENGVRKLFLEGLELTAWAKDKYLGE